MSNQKTQVVTYSRVTAKEQTKGYSLEFQRELVKPSRFLVVISH